jgi:Flagellar biosynthesis protein, FliO
MNGREARTMGHETNTPALPAAARLPFYESRLFRLACSISAFFSSIKVRRRERHMHLCETLPLGEKRLLALVEVEKRRFLIAATNQSISLLHSFDAPAGAGRAESALGSVSSLEETR